MHYMFGGKFTLPIVIRASCGSRYPVASGAAQHSQSLEAWFIHTPGLKVAVPSTPNDAKGLLKTAIRDNNPTLFFEHKLMYYAKRLKRLRDEYDTIAGIVPQGDNLIPFGSADIKRAGKDVTIVATMMMVHKALKAAKELSNAGIDVEIVDPRTLVPLDKNTDPCLGEKDRESGSCLGRYEDGRSCSGTREHHFRGSLLRFSTRP